MVTGYTGTKLNKELKELSRRFSTAYNMAVQNSEAAYKRALAPGQTFQQKKGFYRNEDKAAFCDQCEGFRKQAHDLLDDVTKKLIDEATAAPSPEAVATIQLLQTRKNVSADEIDHLMTKYIDNVQTYKALKELAEDKGYFDFKKHPSECQAEAVQILSDSIDRTFSPDAYPVVNCAGWEANTDQAFSPEG